MAGHEVQPNTSPPLQLPKAPTGIVGLDEITGGGFPRGRPILICGGPGCGKTLFAMEFLVRGATQFDEPGVFITFEERPEELAQNVRSLGFDIDQLTADGRLAVDFIQLDPAQIDEAGEYDLEGLFIRLGLAIDTIGAKRVVIDTIETLLGGLQDVALLRAELRRLFRWLKDRRVTAIVTGERGDGTLTRQGLEEYVSDCVILLDNRVQDQQTTRRLRIVKYRGSLHGVDEYPFLIDSDGISVLPVSSASLDHAASVERISSGIPRLDAMLDGQGYFRGSSIMLSGAAGAGKSIVASQFADAACARGERVLYFAYEESPRQMVRNMRSVGMDLQRWVDEGLLVLHASRPTLYGLESHLVSIHNLVKRFDPSVVVVDPLSNFSSSGSGSEVHSMLLRLVDFLKSRGITAFVTTLSTDSGSLDRTELEISSLVDTWILLRFVELGGERNRALYVLKSRGMAHSNQIRSYVLTDRGVELDSSPSAAGD